MRGLYAIIDTKLLVARRTDIVAFTRAVLDARPAALQLRAKDLPARETLNLLRAIGPMCRTAGVPLVANDRADLAALAGCDMVHIGQEDLPYELVHRIAPHLGVGISTHNLTQLAKALDQRPRYVAYGPIFATTTKSNPDPVVGLEGLRQASRAARAANVTLVAIGGITLSRVHELAPLVDCCAAISDLYPPDATLADVAQRARAFHQALGGAPNLPTEARP
jgi:thiamine-phosphate pyrophosphorylase